ncbi:MobH family relaxase [Aliivibrio fischeri]|uniref:MobH family relaxase n=1 Tax=Aliivibrio fischeri TaxID=668 RepID=UPI0007C47B7F|nr:MobH family relaxase [Aliivibrio fischeri]
MAKSFLPSFFRKKIPLATLHPHQFIAKSGDELLAPHKELIEKIYECTGVPKKTWDEMYLQLFKNGAEMMQELPASAAHHHSERGGLLLHSLELALLCARAKAGVQYTPNNQEDQANRMKEVFSYAVISAGFLHDIGKLVTDIHIRNKSRNAFWPLIISPIPVGDEYVFQWRKDKSRSRKDHEQAGALLVSKIMPPIGIEWLIGIDMDVFRKWTSSVTGHGEGYGGEIYDCIHKADIHSAKKNMINNPVVSMNSSHKEQAINEQNINKTGTQRYYHEPFVSYWSESISNGLLKINKAGGSVWILEDVILLVSPLLVTDAIKAIRDSGKNIPSDLTPNIKQLNDCNLLVDFDNSGMQLFDAIVKIPKRARKKAWEHELKFIAIQRSLLDPQNVLPEFQGQIVSTSSGEVLYEYHEEKTKEDQPTNETDADKVISIVSNDDLDKIIGQSTNVNNSEQPPLDIYDDMPQEVQSEDYYHLSDSIADLTEANPIAIDKSQSSKSNNIIDSILASTPKVSEEKYSLSEEDIQSESKRAPGSGMAFWDWLECKIIMKKLDLNKSQSFLHIVSRGNGAQLFLVSPAIFIEYLFESKIVDNKVINTPPELKSLQRGLFNLKRHEAIYGKDIIIVNVKKGARGGVKKLNGVLLTTDSTKALFGDQYTDLRVNKFISFMQ